MRNTHLDIVGRLGGIYGIQISHAGQANSDCEGRVQ